MGGFVGVDIFFVLSGFLITSILAQDLKERGQIRYGRFYYRRFLRLMPPLLLVLTCYLLIAPFIWPGYNHALDALLTGLYVSDYSYSFWRMPLYLQHSWSLAVEEQFYLLWPILLVPLVRSRRALPYLILVYFACMLWRHAFASDWRDYYYRFDTRMTGLILGAIIYFVRDRIRVSQTLVWGGAALLGIVFFFGDIRAAALFIPVAEIAAALVICGVVTGNAGAIGALLARPAIVALGKLSYGIYLWHFPIAYAIRDTLPFAQTAMIVGVSSVGLAAVSYFTVEAWARSLKLANTAGPISAPVAGAY